MARKLAREARPAKAEVGPGPRSQDSVQRAALHLLEIAVCHSETDAGAKPGAKADEPTLGLLRRVVPLLLSHLGRRGVRAWKSHVVMLTSELEFMYRQYDSRPGRTPFDLETDILDFFSDTLGIPISEEVLTELVLTKEEVTAERGPVEAAKQGVALMLKLGKEGLGKDGPSKKGRAIGYWKQAGLDFSAPTAFGRKATPEQLLRYLVTSLAPFGGDRKRAATEIRLRRVIALLDELERIPDKELREEWRRWRHSER